MRKCYVCRHSLKHTAYTQTAKCPACGTDYVLNFQNKWVRAPKKKKKKKADTEGSRDADHRPQ